MGRTQLTLLVAQGERDRFDRDCDVFDASKNPTTGEYSLKRSLSSNICKLGLGLLERITADPGKCCLIFGLFFFAFGKGRFRPGEAASFAHWPLLVIVVRTTLLHVGLEVHSLDPAELATMFSVTNAGKQPVIYF
jgi:hypothetical protein